MALNYLFKKTNLLSLDEKEQLCSLFSQVYGKEMSVSKFESKYSKTTFGYSYHSLLIDSNKIVGSYSVLPMKYNYFGREYVFALSVDTMIGEKYRGNLFNLKKIANMAYEAAAEDNIPFVYGFPNDNFYLVIKKILKWRDIGALDYYILPIKIGAFKAQLNIFNSLSSLFAFTLDRISASRIDRTDNNYKQYGIEKVIDNDFMEYRYAGDYRIINFDGNSYFAYKIELENGIKIAHLIDVYPLGKREIEEAVSYIYKREKMAVDAIAYVGRFDFRPINLIKLPKKLEPKKIHMAGRILIESAIDERVFNIDNWSINLSNYDVR